MADIDKVRTFPLWRKCLLGIATVMVVVGIAGKIYLGLERARSLTVAEAPHFEVRLVAERESPGQTELVSFENNKPVLTVKEPILQISDFSRIGIDQMQDPENQETPLYVVFGTLDQQTQSRLKEHLEDRIVLIFNRKMAGIPQVKDHLVDGNFVIAASHDQDEVRSIHRFFDEQSRAAAAE